MKKKTYYTFLTAKRGIYNKYKRDARRRDIAWNLDYNQFFAYIREPCYYCGTVGSLCVPTSQEDIYYYNGIDRVDNRRGYFLDNCVPCCNECNRSKGIMTKDAFISMAQRISSYQDYKLYVDLKRGKKS